MANVIIHLRERRLTALNAPVRRAQISLIPGGPPVPFIQFERQQGSIREGI